MPDPIYISASAISKKRRCQRIIGFEYVEKIRPPSGPKRQFGIDGHEHLARWLKGGVPPDDSPEGRAAKQAIRRDLLPPPGPDLRVEEKFEVPAPDVGEDVFFVGYIDLEWAMGHLPVVTDHKFTSSLRYAMDPRQLEEDPQGLLYAAAVMHRTGARKVLGRWNYLVATNPKKGPRKPGGVRKVEHAFDQTDASFKRGLRLLVEDARRIVEIRRRGTRGNDLPPSPQNCRMYGGCDHACRCDVDPLAEANALVAAAEPLTDCADLDIGIGANEEGATMSNSLEERLRELAAEACGGDGHVNPPPESNPNAGREPAANEPAPAAAPAPQEPAGERCGWCGKTFKRLATHKKSCPKAPAAQPLAPVPAQTPAQAMGLDQPPIGRTLPMQGQAEAQAADEPREQAEGFVAVFDALFVKNETLADGVRRLEEVVKPLADQVARENQAAHWGQVKYAQGGPQLAAKLEAWLDQQNGSFTGVLMCDSQMAETRACREVIVRRAGVVVQGVR